MPKKYNENQAATAIQALWHGYKTRQALKTPDTKDPIVYSTFVTGNEPRGHLPMNYKMNGYFVFIGTSGLMNLHWIKEVTAVPVKTSDGFTGVPKLYLVDLSREVYDFWKLLKKIMANSGTFNQFQKNVLSAEESFRRCCTLQPYGVAHEIIHNMMRLSQDSSGTLSHAWFQYFKNVVSKASIICEDWTSETTFKYIRNFTDTKVPVVVYASNILEFVGNAFQTRNNNVDDLVSNIVKNLEKLTPTLMIHARTSQAKSSSHAAYPGEVRVGPDIVIVLNKDQIRTDHLKSLNDPQYIPLVAKLEPPTSQVSASSSSTQPSVKKEDNGLSFMVRKGFFNEKEREKVQTPQAAPIPKPIPKDEKTSAGLRRGFFEKW